MKDWVWVFGAGAFLLNAAAFYGGWVVSRYRGESAAKKTEQLAGDVAVLRVEFQNYKAEAATRFATIEMLEKSEDRVVAALNRLADRLDRLIEART